MRIQSITGWQDHLQSGYQYLKTANKGLARPTVFNNELIFQLAAMGIEKLIAGVCQYHHKMPCDHTLSGLVTDLADVCPIDPDLVERIKRLERIDDMCTLSPERRTPPDSKDIRELLAVGDAVVRFTRQTVPEDTKKPVAA